MLQSPMEMDFETNSEYGYDVSCLPIGLSNNNLKLELLDGDFKCINNCSSSYLQNFDHLDNFPMETSLSNLDCQIQTNAFDPFDPFCHDSSSDFVLSDVKPFEENGSNSGIVQNIPCGDMTYFPNWKNSLVKLETASVGGDPKPLSFVMPVEISCATADDYANNNKYGFGRSQTPDQKSIENEYMSAKKSGRLRKKSKSAKGQWTVEEDRVLTRLVEKYGVRKWSSIAQILKGRIGKQCRERWHNHLRPDIKKDMWTEEEDRVLIEAHAEVGNKWAEIAKRLPGRTENSIKNHWNATKRRQFSRRKCRTKWPKPSSLLQNYIKSLNFEKGNNSRTRITTPGISNNVKNSTERLPEVGFSSVNHVVPEYGLNQLPGFEFPDDRILEGSGMDSFLDDIPDAPPIDESCFDVEELPFDMPPLMHSEVKNDMVIFYEN